MTYLPDIFPELAEMHGADKARRLLQEWDEHERQKQAWQEATADLDHDQDGITAYGLAALEVNENE